MDRTRWMKSRRLIIIGIKYALASAVALWASRFMDLPDRLSCVFVTLLILQPNLLRGLRTSWDQFKATIVATLVTTGSVILIQPPLQIRVSVLQMALTLGVTMIVLMTLRLIQNTPVALFTVTYLSTLPSMVNQSFWATVHVRFGSILLGIAVGTIFNFLSSRFRYRDRFYLSIRSLSERMADFMESWSRTEQGDGTGSSAVTAPMSNLDSIETAHRSLRSDLQEVDWEFRYLHPLMGAEEREIHRCRRKLAGDLETLLQLLRSLAILSGDAKDGVSPLSESQRQRVSGLARRFREAVERFGDSSPGSAERIPSDQQGTAGEPGAAGGKAVRGTDWILDRMETAVDQYRNHVRTLLREET